MNLWEKVYFLLGDIDAVWSGLSVFFSLTAVVWKLMHKPKKYFPSNDDDFYKYYSNQIAKAKREIWITSDGFNVSNSDSSRYAKIMMKGFDKAVSRGVIIHRFQIVETMHINWLDELIRAKKTQGDKLKIYCNQNILNMSNVCAIDPLGKHCVTESMEHKTGMRDQGSKPATYVFRHKDSDSSIRTMQIVKEAIERPGTKELNAEGLDRLKEDLLIKRMEKLRAWMASSESDDGLHKPGASGSTVDLSMWPHVQFA